MAHYLDTSALVKFVVAEPESPALRRWSVAAGRVLITSDLARTELLRAVRRTAADRTGLAREVLDALTILRLSTAHYEQASRLDPPAIRSLDALHLAVALDLGDDLESIVTYDDRLAAAASGYGIAVTAPG